MITVAGDRVFTQVVVSIATGPPQLGARSRWPSRSIFALSKIRKRCSSAVVADSAFRPDCANILAEYRLWLPACVNARRSSRC